MRQLNRRKQEELFAFIQRAKQQTWATGGNKAPSPIPGTKLHQYSEGDLSYVDLYAGFQRFSGTEMVMRGATPLWCMSYHGRVQRDVVQKQFPDKDLNIFCEEVYDFLKRALQQPVTPMIFRGPPSFYEKPWEYECDQEDRVIYFSGEERIYYQLHRVYLCTYQGQLLC